MNWPLSLPADEAQPDLSLASVNSHEAKLCHNTLPLMHTDPPSLYMGVELICGPDCGSSVAAAGLAFRPGADMRDHGPLAVAVRDMDVLPPNGYHPYLGRKPGQVQEQRQGQGQGHDEDDASMHSR